MFKFQFVYHQKDEIVATKCQILRLKCTEIDYISQDSWPAAYTNSEVAAALGGMRELRQINARCTQQTSPTLDLHTVAHKKLLLLYCPLMLRS